MYLFETLSRFSEGNRRPDAKSGGIGINGLGKMAQHINGDISVFPKGNLDGPGDPTGLRIKNGVVSLNP